MIQKETYGNDTISKWMALLMSKRLYAVLLVHYILSYCALLGLHEVAFNKVYFYSIIAFCTLPACILCGFVLLRYPSERFNPLLFLSVIYPVQFGFALLLTMFHQFVKWDILLMYYDFINHTNLINAMLYALQFSIVCLSGAYFLSITRLWKNIYKYMKDVLTQKERLLTMLTLILVAVEFGLMFTGKVTLQGESLIDKDMRDIKVNPFVSIVNPIACVGVFVSAYYYSVKRKSYWILLILIQFAWFFLWGRRNIVYCAFIIFLGYWFDKVIRFRRLNTGSLVRLSITVAAILFVSAAANLYNQLRIVGGVALLQEINLNNISQVIQNYRSINTEELINANEFNIEVRTLSTTAAIAKYDKLIEAGGIRFGNGLEVYNSLLRASPSGYFVDKSSLYTMELLAARLTDNGISPDRDIGDSILLEGMIDFGKAGAVIYACIMVVLLYLGYWCVSFLRTSMVLLVFVVTVLFAILTMIEGGIGVLFLAIRMNLVIVLILTATSGLVYAVLSYSRQPSQFRSQ